uniref:PB1 domain-containing protein n=1 Tax=Angiostrongylus cantonensis TaxID=6313 RepID=A0A0K0CZI9_ANGCA
MTEPNSEPKSAHFKVYRESTQRFTIEYKEKDDLYRSFQKNIEELSIPPLGVYLIDNNGDSIQIGDADTLFGIVKDSPNARVAVCAEDDRSHSSSDCAEHIHGPSDLKRRMKIQHRSRSKSCDCSCPRDHMWSRFGPWARFWRFPGFYPEFLHDFCPYYDQSPPFRSFGPWNFSIDSRNGGRDDRMRDFEHHFDQLSSFGPFKETSGPTDPRFGYHEQMRDFDFRYDQLPPFSSSKSSYFPMDQRMGPSPFYGMGRGRGVHHRGGMRGGFLG